MTNYKPIYGGVPQVWRLTRTDNMGGVEEVVASVQGVLCKKDLPPFEQRIKYNISHSTI
jgi:hypothetical protein